MATATPEAIDAAMAQSAFPVPRDMVETTIARGLVRVDTLILDHANPAVNLTAARAIIGPDADFKGLNSLGLPVYSPHHYRGAI